MPTSGMTYDSLVADLFNYSEQSPSSNTILAQMIPQIITRAQLSLANRLKIQGYRDIVVGQLTPNNRTLVKPTGWRNTITFIVRSNTANTSQYPIRNELRARAYEFIMQRYPDTTEVGLPALYTDYNFSNWVLGPTPDEAYPFEITYYRLPPIVSPEVQTNYLTDYAPNALLYQCLMHLAPYLDDDSRIPTWKLMLDQELAAINAEELSKIVDRTQTRSTQ